MPRHLISIFAVAAIVALSACAAPTPPDRIFPVFFDDYSAVLDTPAQAVVARAATVAKQFPRAPVTVQGFADEPTDPALSARYSKARADTVAMLLIADGVSADRVQRSAKGTPPGSEPGVPSRRAEIDVDVP